MIKYISRVVKVGNLLVGGDNPIRIQSMTNTNTLNTDATVSQIIRMIKAGAELVRITAPGPKEAENLVAIKNKLHSLGYKEPLIADIHYSPKAAEIAAAIVEKVRINPGNYIGKKAADKMDYTNEEYNEELETIAKSLTPLIEICKHHGTAIRIGVNQGSLGGRIMQRYGDTVKGMVTSAVEYARICDQLDFHNLILSVKASNTIVMVNAYRELAAILKEEGLNYPLHVGVTEAGDGEDGRLKSIAGIGAVLAHGIGDTIRVSLTEPPEAELPVAASIVKQFSCTSVEGLISRSIRSDVDRKLLKPIYLNDKDKFGAFPGFNDPIALLIKKDNSIFIAMEGGKPVLLQYPVLNAATFVKSDANTPVFVLIDKPFHVKLLNKTVSNQSTIPDEVLSDQAPEDEMLFDELLVKLQKSSKAILLLKLSASDEAGLVHILRMHKCSNPVILMSMKLVHTIEEVLLENSLHPGSLLIDGLGQGLCIEAGELPMDSLERIGFGVLQATRARITRTEYISCPSCGRTHFDIQQRLQEVKRATSHLKGLKIAVMGCIVNGPGEMADANYGYVGAGAGLVTLYKSKLVMRNSVPEKEAVDALVELIKENGDWVNE